MLQKTIVTAAALLLAATGLAPTAVQAQTLTLKISGENPATGLDLQMAQKFADILTEQLGDDFSYELFHTQALGDENVHLQMIRTGQIDIYPMGSEAVSLDPSWAIFDMPFLFKDRETVARLLDGEVGQKLRASMREAAGLELLALGELGFRQITNNVRPIVVPADLQGIKLRVPGSKTRILTFETYGASPVTMNAGEMYLALQQGTMDGQENPLFGIKYRSLDEVQKYLSMSNHVYTPVTFVMNGARYDGLSDAHKAAVDAAALEAAKYIREVGAKADQELAADMATHMEVSEIDLAAFTEASKPVWTAIGEIAGKEFADEVIAAAQQ
ncbi:MAG: TRAP transporter substrate-binding protein [Rhizobiales bacterium]|nr:TRAP transporter substrate-binding protein [Hyphomicrobiales bacterium]